MNNTFSYKKGRGILFFLLLVANFLSAQTNTKAAFEDSLSKDFCESFSKVAPTLKKENMQMELGVIILPLFSKYKEQIQSEWKMDVENTEDIEKIGEKVGQIAVLNCPAFMQYIKQNLDDIKKDPAKTKSLTAKFLKLEGSPFVYLLTQTAVGKTEKIFWMEFFEGADVLAMPVKLVNKQIRIQYKELEVYDNVIKDYKVIKIATKLETNL